MSTFGTLYRVHTYGESHCASVGGIVDGIPPGLPLSNEMIQKQLARRRPGQSDLSTPRNEYDEVAIQSGVENGVTLGTPIGFLVRNKDQRPHDYAETDLYPRPSHADWTYLAKYGIKASSGGGRSSARETISRVAAGAIAEEYLTTAHGIQIVAFVSGVGNIHLPSFDADTDEPLNPAFMQLLKTVSREEVDKELTRCPNAEISAKMADRIRKAKADMDSLGGTVTCVIRGVPAGLGEPCFDKMEALLAHAMLSIPSTKAFEFGSGFRGTEVPGSRHNDMFARGEDGMLKTITNWSGGVQGGITNGEDIYFRVGFKPPATISQAQQTAKYDGTAGVLEAKGRHDPCVVPRAVPIVEAMAACAVLDAIMIQASRSATANLLPPITTLPPTMVMPGMGRHSGPGSKGPMGDE